MEVKVHKVFQKKRKKTHVYTSPYTTEFSPQLELLSPIIIKSALEEQTAE